MTNRRIKNKILEVSFRCSYLHDGNLLIVEPFLYNRHDPRAVLGIRWLLKSSPSMVEPCLIEDINSELYSALNGFLNIQFFGGFL